MFDEQAQNKIKHLAELELTDGKRVVGEVFLSPHQKLPDLLNNELLFLPIELPDGSISHIRKMAINRVRSLQTHAPSYDGDNPYRILGVSKGDDSETIKHAYRARMHENHPDRVAGLGLDQEFVLLAHKRSARINAAYERITQPADRLMATDKPMTAESPMTPDNSTPQT